MRSLTLSLAVLTFSSAAAIAQTPLTFDQVDTDGDGRLSYTELQTVWPDLTQDEFAAADAEGTGSITPDQLDSLQPASVPAPAETAPKAAPLDAAPAADPAPADALAPLPGE